MARILFVDDTESVRGLVGYLLRDAGHQVTLLSNGSEALELIAQGPGQFDLVLTDDQMPQITGTQLIRQLRARGYSSPIILMSGTANEQDAKDSGASAYLPKPSDNKDILETIKRLLPQ